jgi:RNA polymerase sigma-70 factor (ECF subfamily)
MRHDRTMGARARRTELDVDPAVDRDLGAPDLEEHAQLDDLEEADTLVGPIPAALLLESGARPIARPDDLEIASLLATGEHDRAIGLAARRFGPAVVRLCTQLLGGRGEGDEAAQETFLAAYHGADRFRGDGSPRAWIFGIARRLCVQRIAARVRQDRRRSLLATEAWADDPSMLHDDAEREASVRQALADLSNDDREILALRYDAEQPFREIAQLLAIDEAAARKRVGRALERLRARLRL